MSNSNTDKPVNGPGYWKSLRELNNDPIAFEAKANEFMKGVTDDFDINQLSGLSRRKFLAVLSASVAFAASSCTNYKDKGDIVPYTKKPEEVTPGVANFYASTCTGCSNACGILVTTREGRPIKVDGNPEHPVNKGKICAIGQASVLNLYDPGRLKAPVKSAGGGSFSEIAWKSADGDIISALEKTSSEGREIAVITHSVQSPTGRKILDDFLIKYPTARFYTYELSGDAVRNAAWVKSYGSGTFPLINWDSAKIIVSLESDFLGNEGHTIENVRLYSMSRDVMSGKEFNRLYSVESAMSVTGMAADHRLRLRPDAQFEFIMSLINEIEGTGSPAGSGYSLKNFAEKYKISDKILNNLVNDLKSNRGAAIVYAGDKLPEEAHIAVNYLNELLGNTALYNNNWSKIAFTNISPREEWEGLIQRMNGGQVGVLINYDTNPVYHLPADYGFENALKKVPTTVTLSQMGNETSFLTKYSLPINHDLESWGDFLSRSGVYSLQQPVIAPLFKTRQKEAVLLTWHFGNKDAYKDNIYHDYLMTNWEKQIYPSLGVPLEFRIFWNTALHDGVVISSRNNTVMFGSFNRGALSQVKRSSASGSYAVYLKDNYTIGDGRHANNGWLLELPHPASKVVWDNYAALSVATAKELGVENNDKILVTIGGRKQEFPVFIQPGLADKTVVVELGYGRWRAGEVGNEVGVNAGVLMSKNPSVSNWIYNDAKISKASGSYKLVTTQEMHSLDDTRLKDIHLKRGIIREGTVSEFKANPALFPKSEREKITMNKNPEYTGVKWAMGIDLNKCTGCNACVISCDVENNVPVVGKEQVDKGREMHWFRIDRYYSGTAEEPVVSQQPMLCQHCDTAPCENVCPVAATTHSPDGLNQMAYNRCVGTRYCSNNCPYKVRRFNFFDFRDDFADGYYYQEPGELVHNPEVTVRSRGVMEKCTFCIQRIMSAREEAIEQGRPVKGDDVVVACQQACPSNAIVFGDANDPDSIINKYRKHGLAYHVLEDINTRPNITYLAKLRNTISEG